MKKEHYAQLAWLCALAFTLSNPAAQAQLISNGNFESGLSGWTTLDQLGSDGSFLLQTGSSSPVNGIPVAPPPAGSFAVMTDAQGPGSHVLYQDIFIPVGLTSGTLSFSLFLNNAAEEFFVPSELQTLDFSTPALNQQARVDIITTSADPFSIAAGDVIQNLYQTLPGDPPISGYEALSFDVSTLLTAHQGETLRLRFAAVDNVNIFNVGVDDVSIGQRVQVPDVTGLALIFPMGAMLACHFLRKRSWRGH